MYKRISLLIFFVLALCSSFAQVVTECPQNIGFEAGTFDHWKCYNGLIDPTFDNAPRPPAIVLTESGPVSGQHNLIGTGNIDGYGKFSLDSPNGSDYVVQLGNDGFGRGAERISYTLNVPANVEAYSIVFYYAVVFQNPEHDADEQPKFTAKVIDVTDNTSTPCGSFEFVSKSGLPGFKQSENVADSILYKPWAPVFVNLTPYLGHTIRLEFTTNDCSRGGHFGYAYIDFKENCSIPIIGNITCPGVNSISLSVLTGFKEYNWFDVSTGKSLGTKEQVNISPAPPAGTRIAVQLIPYAGLGCAQTLYTTIEGISLHVNDPPPKCAVDLTATSITAGNSSDLTYSYWQDKAAGVPLSDPELVPVSGTYYIRGESSSGCFALAAVNVTVLPAPDIVIFPPGPVTYPAGIDITKTFTHVPEMVYSYWENRDTSRVLVNPTRVSKSGTYYIKGYSKGINSSNCACVVPVEAHILYDDMIIPNTFTPNGDGINDVLTVLMNSEINVRFFKVYNRWGEPVFSTSDISNFWDGFKGGTRVPAGIYYWILEGLYGNIKYSRSGSVTVLR